MLKNNIPQRRCIGCMTSKNQCDLIRMTCIKAYNNNTNHNPLGINIDVRGIYPGRGFYICKNVSCLEMAIKKKALQRVIKGPIDDETLNKLRVDLVELMD